MSKNYYTILGCQPSATFDELKKSYQELVKKHHPDKSADETDGLFLEVDKAWKVLRDQNMRKEYDATLMQNNFDDQPLVYARLTVDELEFEDGTAYYPCRCGENYIITKNSLESVNIIDCTECSNSIIVENVVK